ncbi:hypothetical protein A3H89_02835 [Candidatus Amesbacteria bacterium RIFCSPLOWO2_02_FULL_48_11]|nr:MAG: hypothetical protein A3H89_02835 [Candidatus Amesbacteria bacterium RIFCSPLOWO2_02_FULL_48_11]
MAELEPKLTVPESVLTGFFASVTTYIREYPIRLDALKVTLYELNAKPHLYHPCDVRQAGNCPDKEFLPNCHKCPHARQTAKKIIGIGNNHGFPSSETHEYSGSGTLTVVLSGANGGDWLVSEQKGDGFLFAHLAITRRL